MGDGLEGLWKQAACKWILEQEVRHLEQSRMIIEPDAEILQGAQIVGQPERLAPPGKNLPVTGTLGCTE